MSSRSALALALAPWLLVAACGGDDDAGGQVDSGAGEPDAAAEPDAAEPDAAVQPGPAPGMLFVLGNQADRNDVLAFARAEDGGLTPIGSYPAGGLGSGAGLGSQAAIVVSGDHRFLFAVDAGSDEVSSFRVHPDHLALVDVVASGGVGPISVAAGEDRLYVLNGGGAGSVSGFAVAEDGRLTAIEGATRPLSPGAEPANPAQVSLGPDGRLLVVSEKGTSRLTTYAVGQDGSLGDPVATESSGQTPFGFAFTPAGVLVVSEAGGGPDGTSAVSSYAARPDGSLEPISRSVPSGQRAACWIALARDARYAYATNAQSNTISGFRVAEDGRLTLFGDDGVTAALGDGQSPIDMALGGDDSYLYALAGGGDVVVGMRIEEDGRLTRQGADTPVPATAVGLAGF